MSKEEAMPVEGEDPLSVRAEVGPVGRMLDCSQADDRKMIRLVRERPLLYARNNMPVASFYSQVKQLWQEVADIMGWSVADVRRKWSHIRNSYSRHLRNEMYGARTGKGRVVSRWYLADELQFLREHMATDTRTSPYSQYLPTMVQTTLTEPQTENVDIKPFINNPWFTLATTATKSEPTEHYNDDSSSSQALDHDENSAYFQFFRGIYHDYQELTAKKQRQFRRQCLNFLHDLLDEDDNQVNSETQNDVMNLSNSAQSSVEVKEQKLFVIEKVDSGSN